MSYRQRARIRKCGSAFPATRPCEKQMSADAKQPVLPIWGPAAGEAGRPLYTNHIRRTRLLRDPAGDELEGCDADPGSDRVRDYVAGSGISRRKVGLEDFDGHADSGA